MKKLYIIRHGETDFNRMNIVQGNGVDTDLNETGLNQGFLFYNKYKNIALDKIYISALKRTQQTIQHFINDGIPFEKLAELNEISWGDFEGKVQDFKEREFYQHAVNAWDSGNYNVAVANGETPNQLQERQKKALDFIMKNTHEKTVLICMHGRALKSFICLLLDMPLMNMDKYQHQNTCLYQLDFDGKKFELIIQNDVSHLEQ
jgi:probable phosphoglycerate mutase